MRSETSYEKVFSVTTDLKLWPKIAYLLKITDSFLESVRPSGNVGSEHFLKSRRQILSFLTVSRIFGNFNFSVNDLISLDIIKYSDEELRKTWQLISETGSFNVITKKIKESALLGIYEIAAKMWKIKGIGRFKKESTIDFNEVQPRGNRAKPIKAKIHMDFALKVNELLPSQPWKPGIDKEVITQLNCSRQDYFEAVKLLIEEGLRHKQINGVVYDEDGNVLFFDEERVHSETLQLKEE